MRRRAVTTLVSAGVAAMSAPARGDVLPQADKMIVLVRAEGCDFAALEPRLHKAGKAMTRDGRTTRVIIDWPADPARNLDLMGHASPFIAAIEVSGAPAALKSFAPKLRRKLGNECAFDSYLVAESRLSTAARDWALGEPSPQLKVLVTMMRLPGLTREQFVHEWSDVHAGISLAWRRARGWAGHYVQNVVVEPLGDAPPLDGIGEIEGQTEGPVSDEERKARENSAAHAQTFQDFRNSAMFVAREIMLKD